MYHSWFWRSELINYQLPEEREHLAAKAFKGTSVDVNQVCHKLLK